MDQIKNKNISALILAAGYSLRMGDFKPLMQIGSHSAIEHAIRTFQQVGISDIKVVAGFRADELSKAVKPLGAEIVCNPNFAQGMYTSVQVGVRALESEVRAFFMLPVDIPLVSCTTVKKMLDCSRLNQYGIIYPVFNGMRGHPPLITTRYKDEILHGDAHEGLRGILELHQHEAYDIKVEDETVLLDMDTQEDYCRLLNYLHKKNIPSLERSWKILSEARIDERIEKHCFAVACTAIELAGKLNSAGAGLDENFVLASALLHDIARHEPNHASAGAKLLEEIGYPLVATAVGEHMDIEVNNEIPLTEAELVYYADKIVKENTIVSINSHFAATLHKYNDDPQASAVVLKRLRQAERIERKIKKIMGYPNEAILAPGFHLL